ncbi:MAG TPA: Imm8 family immunity protein [Polyangia bacterium]|nr:Imm8 family immunity protein [Polyangia bacterium]
MKINYLDAWRRCCGDIAPVGFLLRRDRPGDWLRVHYFDDERRAPTTPSGLSRAVEIVLALVIELVINTLSSPDIEIDVCTPNASDDVFFLLELEIGAVGGESADLFQILVATPEGLRSRGQGDVISERALLVVSKFSWKLVHSTLSRIVNRCAKKNWIDSVSSLQRYFEWEYEEYVQAE